MGNVHGMTVVAGLKLGETLSLANQVGLTIIAYFSQPVCRLNSSKGYNSRRSSCFKMIPMICSGTRHDLGPAQLVSSGQCSMQSCLKVKIVAGGYG